MAKPALPDALKKANWDKQKGIVAKLVQKETGIGASLEGLTSAYNAVPWDKLDEAALAHAKTGEDMKKIFAAGRAVLTKEIKTAREKSLEVGRLAKKWADDFKKNKLIPKSTLTYLDTMSNRATWFSTTLLDEPTASLLKMEESIKEFDEHFGEVTAMGKQYVENRKKALLQMEDLEAAFTKLKQDFTRGEAASQKFAETGGPANVQKIQQIIEAAKKSIAAGEERWKTEGDVNKNEVQRVARAKLGQYKIPSMQRFLLPYAQQSESIFNKIMACTANIIRIRSELQAILTGLETDLEIAAEKGGQPKNLQESQAYARDVTKQTLAEAVKLQDNAEKMAKSATLIPNLLKTLKDPRTPPEQRAQAPNLVEANLGEIRRRIAVVQAAITKIKNLQKRLLAMPKEIQADGVVKGELAKIDGVIRQLEALVKQGQGNLANSEQVAEQVRALL
ncbi:MAG TPA: hypothetical protein VHQ47_17590 [Phycisphaerae bacterium]|nr:hypothetical protein [Phycisphaerae bacterium]